MATMKSHAGVRDMKSFQNLFTNPILILFNVCPKISVAIRGMVRLSTAIARLPKSTLLSQAAAGRLWCTAQWHRIRTPLRFERALYHV